MFWFRSSKVRCGCSTLDSDQWRSWNRLCWLLCQLMWQWLSAYLIVKRSSWFGYCFCCNIIIILRCLFPHSQCSLATKNVYTQKISNFSLLILIPKLKRISFQVRHTILSRHWANWVKTRNVITGELFVECVKLWIQIRRLEPVNQKEPPNHTL